MKSGNRDEKRFFKPKEPNFLLNPWTPKTRVGPHKPVRTVQSNPLAIFFYFLFFEKKQLNTILFYLIKLSISYKELNIYIYIYIYIIEILQRYSTLLQKLIKNFNVFIVIILFY